MYIPPSVGKTSKFIVFAFLENPLSLAMFIHVPSPESKLQAAFFKNLCPQTERSGENYDLLCQSSIRKYEDDLDC